jgi:hypothetical protein
MATSSRRERDGFLTSATQSKRRTGEGIEGDSTPSDASRYFAGPDLIKQWLGHSQNLRDLYVAQLRYDAAYRR